jgi:fatty-acyl-CoA synthase
MQTNAGAWRGDVASAGRLTVHELFRACARRAPDMVAIETASAHVTYGELDRRVLRLAAALSRAGIRRGDRIALLSENRQEYAEIELAAACLGAIVACQNWRLAPAELQHCIDLVDPSLIIASARYAATARGLELHGRRLLILEDEHERLIADNEPLAELPSVDPEDGLVILYTSGTTGMPKGALISHRAEMTRNMVLRVDMHARESDGFIAWAPMFHMGSTDQVLGALMSGATVSVVDGFDAERIMGLMERHELGWMLLMPGSIEPMVEIMQRTARRPKSIRAIGAMADLVPSHLIADLTRLANAPYLNSFGSTETGLPPASACLLPPGQAPQSLSKRKSAFCELKLVDADGNEVPDGEPGEAAVRGPTVFSGYWNAPETNARDFAGGYFRMGDLFRRNGDGTYDFVDRAKYMIKSGGENIYPAEIERVLLSDPRVTDAIVVRRKDDRWGEVPVAFISRSDESLSENEVEALCRRELAGYKRPKAVHFIRFEDFPRSTTGKILRHEMEARLPG